MATAARQTSFSLVYDPTGLKQIRTESASSQSKDFEPNWEDSKLVVSGRIIDPRSARKISEYQINFEFNPRKYIEIQIPQAGASSDLCTKNTD